MSVLIAGTYNRSDAYPNVKYRIEHIHADGRFEVLESHLALGTTLDYSSRSRLFVSAVRVLVSLLSGSLAFVSTAFRHRHRSVLYMPYPCIHLLWLLSFLPRRVAPPRVVADAFISVYDTVVNDRRLLRRHGVAARLLFAFERRAFRRASLVVTDTPENSRFYARTFDLPPLRFRDVPLSIAPVGDEIRQESRSRHRALRLVFVGTLVPLHGIGVLCEALRLLPPDLGVDVVLVGDGQDAPVVSRFMQSERPEEFARTVTWLREWQSTGSLIRLIRSADLCLGIFGSEGKSQRVLPFKSYLYLACGRPLITSRTAVTVRLRSEWSGPNPVLAVEPNSPSELAERIVSFARHPERARALREPARKLFEGRLSDTEITRGLWLALAGGRFGEGHDVDRPGPARGLSRGS